MDISIHFQNNMKQHMDRHWSFHR